MVLKFRLQVFITMKHDNPQFASRKAPMIAIACVCLGVFLSTSHLPSAVGADSPALQTLLDHAGKAVAQFSEEFAAVTCTELVTQAKLGNRAKIIYERQSVFDFLFFIDLHGDALSVEESRLAQKPAGKEKKKKQMDLPLLTTNGFSTLALIFHPYYQGSFEFDRIEDVAIDGKESAQVRFRHIPGTRSTAALFLKGKDYPLDLQGTAWIDLESGKIIKIAAGLMAPLQDLNLRTLNSSVSYGPVRFPSSSEVYWLPLQASVDVETRYQHWRNIHQFSDYKVFSVKTEATIPQKK
jgi:hypothetical protein